MINDQLLTNSMYHKLIFFSLILLTLQTITVVMAEDAAPLHVSGAITVDTVTANMLHVKGYPFVDVRGIKHFSNGHIPGAYHLAIHSEDFTIENLNAIAKKNQPVIFYCNGIHCMGSSIASQKAVEWGWTQVAYYREGIPQWKEQGLAIE